MKKIGLTLSGGGYRAAAFHIGTLNKLHEMKILPNVDVLSTISGGSITGACYCLWEDDFQIFRTKMIRLLSTQSIIRNILTSFFFFRTALLIFLFLALSVILLFTEVAFLSPVAIILLLIVMITWQFRIFPVGKAIQKAYDKIFYSGQKLKDLKDRPQLVIGSTNLQTSRPFIFTKEFIEDSSYDHMDPPVKFNAQVMPVSKAVTASTCVPFAFTPVSIEKEYFENPGNFSRINPNLVDGGVYDNQGIHKVTQQNSRFNCNYIIISDAGNKLPFHQAYNNTFTLLLRTMDVFMARIKHFQMIQAIYKNIDNKEREVAYLSLGWDLENCLPGFVDNLTAKNINASIIEFHQLKPEWVENPSAFKAEIINHLSKRLDYEAILNRNLTPEELNTARSVGTNLTKLSEKQIDCLIRHAENLTELLVKLYCPSLLKVQVNSVLSH